VNLGTECRVLNRQAIGDHVIMLEFSSPVRIPYICIERYCGAARLRYSLIRCGEVAGQKYQLPQPLICIDYGRRTKPVEYKRVRVK